MYVSMYYRLNSKELHIKLCHTLLQSASETTGQCNSMVKDTKAQLSVAFKNMLVDFQTISHHYDLFVSSTMKERETMESKIASTVHEWKETVSLKDVEMQNLMKELKEKDAALDQSTVDNNGELLCKHVQTYKF